MSIKVSMHNWMRPEPIEHTIKRLARLGYDGLEISGEPQSFDVAAVRGLLDQHGLECWGAVTLMTAGRDLLDQDPYVRRGSIEYVKDTLTFVSELGGRIVTVVPSTVGKTVPMASAGEEWAWAVESLKRCQEHAESVGVRIALEPLNRFETYFLNTADDAVRLCDEVAHRRVGILFDTFHANIEEKNIAKALALCGDHLKHIHTCENDRGVPGSGHIEWSSVFESIRTLGYDGWLSIESFGSTIPEIAAAACIWRDLAPSADAIGRDGVQFLKSSLAQAAAS